MPPTCLCVAATSTSPLLRAPAPRGFLRATGEQLLWPTAIQPGRETLCYSRDKQQLSRQPELSLRAVSLPHGVHLRCLFRCCCTLPSSTLRLLRPSVMPRYWARSSKVTAHLRVAPWATTSPTSRLRRHLRLGELVLGCRQQPRRAETHLPLMVVSVEYCSHRRRFCHTLPDSGARGAALLYHVPRPETAVAQPLNSAPIVAGITRTRPISSWTPACKRGGPHSIALARVLQPAVCPVPRTPESLKAPKKGSSIPALLKRR
jgi:hypothetical protein